MNSRHSLRAPAKRSQQINVIVLAIVIGMSIWGIKWATFARPPLPEAVAALSDNSLVAVSQDPWLSFIPTQLNPVTGYIFYPGGRIDPKGYALCAH